MKAEGRKKIHFFVYNGIFLKHFQKTGENKSTMGLIFVEVWLEFRVKLFIFSC